MSASIIVSVIVPCYNQGEFLDETLQSVADQTFLHWECLVVDDGSPDNAGEIARKWCNKDSRFIYIPGRNGGVSHSRNLAISKASGEYILPLDGDDKISPDYLQGCIEKFKQNPEIRLVYGRAEKFGKETGVWLLPPYDYSKLLTRNLIYCSAMYRKSDWQRIEGYDVSMLHGLEDWDFWLRLLRESDLVVKDETITFYYRIRETSRNSDLYKSEEKQKETYNYLYTRHFVKMNAIIGNPLLLFIENENLKNDVAALQRKIDESYFSRLIRFVKRVVKA